MPRTALAGNVEEERIMGCPACDSGRIRWRNGVGFEHEMICFACWFTWEPERVNQKEINEYKSNVANKALEAELEKIKSADSVREWRELSGEM